MKPPPHVCVSQNLLQPEELGQEGRLATLVSQKYDVVSREGRYLHHRVITSNIMLYRYRIFAKSKVLFYSGPRLNSHSARNSETGTSIADDVDATMEEQELDSEDSVAMVIDAVPATAQVGLSHGSVIIATNYSEGRRHGPTGRYPS